MDKLFIILISVALAIGVVALIVGSMGFDKAYGHSHNGFAEASHSHTTVIPSETKQFTTLIATETSVSFTTNLFLNSPEILIHHALNERGDKIGSIHVGWDHSNFSYTPGTSIAVWDHLGFSEALTATTTAHQRGKISWCYSYGDKMVPVFLSCDSSGNVYLKYALHEFVDTPKDWPSPTIPATHVPDMDLGIVSTRFDIVNDPTTTYPVIIAIVTSSLDAYHTTTDAFITPVVPSASNIDTIAETTLGFSAEVVNGHIGVAYVTTANALRYSQYDGSAWTSSPTNIVTGVTEDPFLTTVNGFPTIAYYTGAASTISYVTATNLEGTAWGTPVVVDTSVGVTFYQLAMTTDVYNNPIMFYIQNNATPEPRLYSKQYPWTSAHDILSQKVVSSGMRMVRDLDGRVWISCERDLATTNALTIVRHGSGTTDFTLFDWAFNSAGHDLTSFLGRPVLYQRVSATPDYHHTINMFGRLARVANGEYFAHEVTAVTLK